MFKRGWISGLDFAKEYKSTVSWNAVDINFSLKKNSKIFLSPQETHYKSAENIIFAKK